MTNRGITVSIFTVKVTTLFVKF